jgi:hypothetical protein
MDRPGRPRSIWRQILKVVAAVTTIIDVLLESEEPSIRWKIRSKVLGEDPASAGMRALREQIRRSSRVQTLLGRQGPDGRLHAGRDVYAKWQGAHWVLASLADLGYPTGDAALAPMRDQVLDEWLKPHFFAEVEVARKEDTYKHAGVPVIEGRHRRCASQQGNPLLSMVLLGLMDERGERLVERLLHWQWPDGGWNCDKEPTADTSSFMETLLPMRALAAYSSATGDASARAAATRASEVFLERHLFRRRSDGRVMRQEFVELHYPLYWHYDILGGLKGLAELGILDDPRVADALDLLESKRLADGGWPAERRYDKTSRTVARGNSDVDWGGTSVRRMNPWVTADALFVLRSAGRLVV